jgi:hypothetical protein
LDRPGHPTRRQRDYDRLVVQASPSFRSGVL